MTSQAFFWAAGHRSQKLQVVVGAMAMALALSFVSFSSPANAQSEATSAEKVRLCNIAYSIKVKSFGRQLKAVNQAYVEAWQKKRPEDSPSRCRRLYAASDESRLSKLVSIGKAEKVTHLVAPTAGKIGKKIEVSFWLVDVEKGTVVDQAKQSFPLQRNQLKSNLPAFSQKAVEQFLPQFSSIETAPEKPTEEPSPADGKGVSEAQPATAGSSPAPKPVQEAAGTVTEALPQDDKSPPVDGASIVSDDSAPETGAGVASTFPEAPSATDTQSTDRSQPVQSDAAATKPVDETGADATPTATMSTQQAVQVDATSRPRATTPPIWKQAHFMPLAAAAVGAVTGAGLGALVHNVAIAERNRSTDGVADLGQSIWVGGLMGAGVGALAGAWLSTKDLSGSEGDDSSR